MQQCHSIQGLGITQLRNLLTNYTGVNLYIITKTIMTKKQLRIPFKDGKPCKWVKDDHDEERDNYEFEECLEIHGFVRGRSSAVMILRPANDHGEDFNYAKVSITKYS